MKSLLLKQFEITICLLLCLNIVRADWMNTTNSPTKIPENSYIEMRDYILNIDSIYSNYGEIKGHVNVELDSVIPFLLFFINSLQIRKGTLMFSY